MRSTHRSNMMRAIGGLRSPARLARWVLLWFALSLGAAITAPVVHPQRMELVCAVGGAVKAFVQTDDGAQDIGVGAMDCPLCIMAVVPRDASAVALPMWRPAEPVLQPLPRVPLAVFTGAPPPARGPPLFS